MRRIQFIELHDQAWFPASLRDYVTDALQYGMNIVKVYAPVVALLQSALDSTGSQSVVDLCSGGGGPWLNLSRKLQGRKSEGEQGVLQIWLTDRYPNAAAFQRVTAASENRIGFYPKPVDALEVPGELKGFRTMFTAFHHFPPESARAILQNAVDAREGIGIFETTRRAPSAIGLMFVWVFLLCLGTPWIRPFRWSRLLWTYLLPILPVVLLFDGVVSCLRTYRPEELREMVATVVAKGCRYEWEIGECGAKGAPITYLIGCPQASAREGA